VRPISEGPEIPERVPPALLRAWATALRRLQAEHDRAVARAQAANKRANSLAAQQRLYQAELSQLQPRILAAQAAVTRATSNLAAVTARLGEYRSARDAATARLLGTDRLAGTVATSHPLLLLPVRLETRFAPRRTGTGTDLLLRVYPDDIHIDSHEPGVTTEEERWGAQFWQQVAAVPPGPEQLERKRQAWQQLTERFGATRAAWIANALDPARSQAVTRRDDTWTRAPYTQVLPDRWVAIGYRGDRAHVTAWGKPIPETVAVGPAPRGTTLIEDNGLPPIDEGMRWLTDFDAAEAVGMGLRIPLSDEDAQAGFDRVVVLGTKASWDAATTATRLAQLFDAHHYTGGLAFIGQNVPTNNSAEASSGYRSTGSPAAETLEIELGAPLAQPGSDGEVTAKALGLPTSIFAHVQGAGGSEQRHAAAMNAALLALCDSALLRQLSEKTGAEFLRAHFAQFMRAAGPLPALRIDTQPYGLLPVAALDRWMSKTTADAESALAVWWQAQRRLLRHYTRRALHTLTENNPVVMLAQEATSCRYTMREFPEASITPPVPRALIPAALRNLILNRALAAPHDPTLDALLTLPESTRQALLAESIDLATFRFDAWATSLATRRLAALRHADSTGVRLGGYGWVEQVRRAAPLEAVPTPPPGVSTPLARSATNKGYVHTPSLGHAAAAAVLRSGYLSQEHAAGEKPFAVDLSSERVHRAKWLLDGVRQGQSLSALLGYRFERGLHDRGLDRYIHRFRALTSLKENKRFADIHEKLGRSERTAREVAALYAQRDQAAGRAADARALKAEREGRAQTYRLELDTIALVAQQAQAADAQVAQATQALTQQQAAKPQGKVIQPSVRRYAVQLLEERDLDLWADRADQLMQAQSVATAQAAVAHQALSAKAGARAIAERAQATLLNANDPGSIPAAQAAITREETMVAEFDRQALAKEGGQRGKAEADLAAARAELAARLSQQWNEALESLPATNVVDGLALQRRWKASQQRKSPQSPWDTTTIPFGNTTLGFPAPGTNDFTSLVAQLQALDDLVDSVGDSVVAESVYQLVQGNPLRSGATLDAIATGEMPPPELDVIRTPRTGIGLTHRLCALFPMSAGTSPSTWPTQQPSARAQAEPVLNAWVATLLPNPALVRCKAEYVNPQDGQVYQAVETALTALALAPLDAVYMAEATDRAQRGELEQRWIAHLHRTRPASVPAEATVRLQFGRAPGWTNDLVSIGEFCEVTRTVRRLLSNARSIDGRDLSLPESPAASGLDTQEFTGRVTQARQSLTAAHRTLQNLLPADPSTGDGAQPNLDVLRTALFHLASFGIAGAVPMDIGGTGAEARSVLLTQARSVAVEAGRRLERIAEADRTFDAAGATPEERRDHDLSNLRIVFGTDFLALPRMVASNAAQLSEAFGASLSLQANDPLAATTWFQRVAYVRPGAMRMQAAMLYAETMGNGASLQLQVGQLPFSSQDRWVALPGAPDHTIPRGRLSLVAQITTAQPLRFDQPFTGLLIDDWVETVPSRRETTGVTFHFDQPNSAPPQAVLLAVPADQRTTWDLNSLEAILQETMELIRLRAVSPGSRAETVWVEDGLPEGATPFGDGEGWTWVRSQPEPLSGTRAHRSVLAAGMHQHYFRGAKTQLLVSVGDRLFAHIYLDPARMPREVMLQWNDGTWEHRAYWGENLIAWGTDGTVSRQFMGPLPPPGQWVRLEVPASAVGLEGRLINGMAFTLSDGTATWDRAGTLSTQPEGLASTDLSAPALFFTGGTLDFTSVLEPSTGE
jgi:hypothetical protein